MCCAQTPKAITRAAVEARVHSWQGLAARKTYRTVRRHPSEYSTTRVVDDDGDGDEEKKSVKMRKNGCCEALGG